MTATVSDFVEAPLSKTGAATVKRNACMNTGSHVLVPHHFFPSWIGLRAITTGSTLFYMLPFKYVQSVLLTTAQPGCGSFHVTLTDSETIVPNYFS